MNSRLVSIILPCFKAETTLEKCVQCILAQTYSNWELLLLEDGSPDNTLETAIRLAATDQRIRLVASPKNRGVVRMRNIGLRLARGGWIAFCDSDDWWIPEKLEMQLAQAASNKANLVYSAVYYIRARKNIQQKEVQLLPDVDFKTMLKTNAIPMSSAMYSVGSLGKHYFKPVLENFIHEDYAYWLQLFKKGLVISTYVNTPTTYIRLSNQSRSSNLMRAAKSHAYILRKEGRLPYTQIGWNFTFYFLTAFRKRLPWYGWEVVKVK
jgi:teichuronic acid biosynthesis glycosyltransferase TuaG